MSRFRPGNVGNRRFHLGAQSAKRIGRDAEQLLVAIDEPNPGRPMRYHQLGRRQSEPGSAADDDCGLVLQSSTSVFSVTPLALYVITYMPTSTKLKCILKVSK